MKYTHPILEEPVKDTCLRPIGDLAQLIEDMSFEDYMLWMVALSKQAQEKEQHEG